MAVRALPLLAVCLGVAAAAQAPSPGAEPERRPFVRFVEAADGGRLEVLVATYRRGAATVELFAALHVADPEHYVELQRRFEDCEALLYELIADPELRPHPGMALDESDWISIVQSTMERGFSLQDQFDAIDYRKANFVHADMTAEEFEQALEAAGASVLGEVMSGRLPEADREREARQRRLDLVAAFRSGRGAHEMRILGARLMAEPDPTTREPTVLIEGRNEKCLAVLQEKLAAGVERFGIYYGAGHMEHMERRLVADLGFERTGEEWIVAWDCSESRFPKAERGLRQKRYRARRDLDKLRPAVVAWCAAHPGRAPTWDLVRQAQPDGRLPGRADGVDPWGRAYVVRLVDGAPEVRCLGSDGEVDTEDDVTLDGALGNPFAAARAEAKLRTAETSVRTVHDAVKMYYVMKGRLPATLDDLVTPDAAGRTFLESLDPDPWGNAYVLRGSDHRDFAVVCLGPDGVEGTADDVSSRRPHKPPADAPKKGPPPVRR